MNTELVIHKLFSNTAAKFAHKVALQIEKEQQWQKFTYRDVEILSCKVAAFLIQKGYKRKDFAALILENSPDWPIIYLGIVRSGLACVPLDPQLSIDEIKNLIQDSAAKIIFTSSAIFSQKVRQAIEGINLDAVIVEEFKEGSKDIEYKEVNWPEVFPEDIASLVYTSGTTGKPKGVLLSHKNFCSNFLSNNRLNFFYPSDNFLSILPLYHTYAFMATLLTPLLSGASITYCLSLRPTDMAGIIHQAKVTILVGVPQIFSLLHKAVFEKIKKIPFFLRPVALPLLRIVLKRRFGRLRLCVSGGAHLDPRVAKDLFSLGLKVVEGYGLTETSPVVTLNPLQRIKFGSAGKTLPGVQVKILNPDKNGVGQVLIKGENVMQGYFKRPDLTSEVIKDGWFYSGDLGYLDKEGYLFLCAREEDAIVLSSGKNIYPEDLEAYYSNSPYIKEICILLKKETIFGYQKDLLYAVIVPNLEYFAKQQELNIRERIRWDLDTLGRKLATYKHIMGFTLTKKDLPRTVLRKIKRFEVKKKYLAKDAAQPEEGVLSREEKELLETDIVQKVIPYIAKEVNKPVSLLSHLEIDLGIDSLARVELGLGLEALLEIKIPEALIYEVSTIKDLIINLEKVVKGAKLEGEKQKQKSWNEILKELPPSEIINKIKINFGLYEIMLSWLIKQIFLCLVRICWLLRVRGVENLPKAGPYLVCPNHTSYLDGMFIFCSIPFKRSLGTYFLGYQRIFENPALYWTNKICRFISINIDAHLVEALQAVAYVLRQKKLVCIFPEGMRSVDAQVKEFKKGVGILLKELNIPVVPVYIQGGHQAWSRGKRIPRFYPVKVIFGKPLFWQQLGNDHETIASGLRQEVLKLK